MKSVLFVCTANRCRSPMAEALLKDKVQRLGQAGEWRIGSAGTWTEPGQPALPLTQAVLSQRGLNVENHRSRPVDTGLMQSANLILVMTDNHREGLCVEFPNAARKVMLLSRLAGPAYDIEDPAGQSENDYAVCANDITRILERGFERLTALAEQKNE